MEVVDIPFDRTTEWLLERRIVGASYTKSLRTVHARLAAALAAERPAEAPAVAQLVPPGTERASLTYFDAKAVMQALLDAGLGEKTLFGGYSNAHTAQWADIVRRFEAGSIHLADAASAMAQAVGYELPALKKEAARAEKELSELVRRQGEYERLAAAAEERYVAACDKKGLGTDCSREEIGRRLRESRSLLRATLGCPDAASTPLFSDEHPAQYHISPYLPISPHISPYLPISPRSTGSDEHSAQYRVPPPQLDVCPHISPYLPISPRSTGDGPTFAHRLRPHACRVDTRFARVAALCQSEEMGGAVEYYLAYVRHCLEERLPHHPWD